MKIHKLTDHLSVSPQITPEDVAELKAAGFKAIISNRPDGEDFDQPAFDAIAEAAKAAGLEIVSQPVVSSAITDADGDAFGAHVDALSGPVLAYCRSGTRCTVLWALSEADKRPLDDILQTAADAGYDMRTLAPRLMAKAGS